MLKCDPHLDGRTVSVSGREIEELAREHLHMLLADNNGVTSVEVNFKEIKVRFDYILRTLLKYNTMAWGNMTAISLNKTADFGETVKNEFNEAQLQLRSLVDRDLVEPGALSKLFASSFITNWFVDDKGVIRAIERWDPHSLTRLAKPASVDDMLLHLKNEIRYINI